MSPFPLARTLCDAPKCNADIGAISNPLHAAAELGHFDEVIEILTRQPGYAQEFNEDGLTPLHLACREGHLEIAGKLIQTNTKLCFRRDKYGGIPLHIAATKGRLDVVKLFLVACPESVKGITAAGETCLHSAILNNRGKVIYHLVKWLAERTEYAYLINGKDRGGNTPLHIATSRKQLQTLKVLLTDDPRITKLVDVNAMNSGGFTTLDILDVLPYCGKIDMEIDKILRRAGALRGRDITNHNTNQSDVFDSRRGHWTSQITTIYPFSKVRRDFAYPALLVTATLLATITYQAAFSAPGSASKEVYVSKYDKNGTFRLKMQDSIITRSFILFNSTGFIASVAIIIFLLHEFPLKPWPQISVSTLFGSYMCVIMAMSPSEAWVLLFLAIPFLLLAAAGKLHGLGRPGPI